MSRRTFALLTAVITFTAGVAIARLSLTNLFEETIPPVKREVPLSNYRLSGPYRYAGLSIFLVHGPGDGRNRRYTPLQEAVERNIVTIHETNHVNELAIENVSATEEVFVQAGDIVKGGNQDRVLAVDLILPATSFKIPISAFCVENSRWYQRGAETSDHFTLTEMSASSSVQRAIKEVGTQLGVWDEVETSQEKLSAGVNNDVRASISPTSLPLALENAAVQKAAAPYVDNLTPIVNRSDDVIGFAFAINDVLKGADVYYSNQMFKRLWPRLLWAAAIEAISIPPMELTSEGLRIENVAAFLVNTETGEETVSEVTRRTHSAKRETDKGLFFETRDMAHGAAWVHRSYLPKSN
jgi:hypothetical protein